MVQVSWTLLFSAIFFWGGGWGGLPLHKPLHEMLGEANHPLRCCGTYQADVDLPKQMGEESKLWTVFRVFQGFF